MLTNPAIIKQVQDIYNSLPEGVDEFEIKDEGLLQGLFLFVDKKPKYVMLELTDTDKHVYIGSNTKNNL